MTRSMTGFGRAAGTLLGDEVTVEMSAVNHRYLDASLRMPLAWAAVEPVLKQQLRKYVSRGKLSVTISRKRGPGSPPSIRFDPDTARQYVEASRELAAMVGSNAAISVDVLAQLEGVLVHEDPVDDLESVQAGLEALLEDAAARLNAMRATEGEALERDIRARIALIRSALVRIEDRLPELNGAYEQRLRSRIEELRTEVSLSEERIALEVALLAEKADVTEEVVRLKAHLDHFSGLLDEKEPVGRRLDFLLQELQREINTLGVKTRDSDVARHVLEMKSELEKIREQIQNVE